MGSKWNKQRGSDFGDRETVFMPTEVYVVQQDLYKKIWCCPMCGELHLCLTEPSSCHGCEFTRPGLSDTEKYEEVRKDSHKRAAQRIAKKLTGSKPKGGKKK